MLPRPVVFLLILCLHALPVVAEAEFRNFSTRDGLPSGEIFQIESHEGNVLFAAGGGFAVYDGVTFRTWDEADGLPGRMVQCIAFASDGSILLSGEGGIARWDGEDTFVEEVPQDPPRFGDLVVFEIGEAIDGTLWCLGNSGLSRNDGTGWAEVLPPSSPGPGGDPADWTYRALHCARDGSVWVGFFGDGLFRYRDGVWTYWPASGEIVGRNISDIAEDAAGNIWLATESGAVRFDGTTWASFGPPGGLPGGGTIYVFEDSRGAMWFATHPGFSRWADGVWTHFGVEDGLPLEGATTVGEGPDGSIWMGLRFGASRFDGSEWKYLTAADGLANTRTQCTFEDAAGDLWVGGLYGTSRWDGSQWHLLPVVAGSPEFVYDILQDRSGRMWFAAAGGLAIRDGNNWTGPLDESDGFASAVMNDLFEDASGRMWVANQLGVSMLDGTTWSHWREAVDLPPGSYQEVVQDTTGTIWVAGSGGLLRWTGTTGWETVEIPAVNENIPALFTLALTPDGSLWVGGFWALYRRNGEGWTVFSPADGLVGLPVHDLLVDRAGTLWIATEQGVGRLQDSGFGSYTVDESPLPMNTIYNLYEDSRGTIWMNGQGLVRHVADRTAPLVVPVTRPPEASSSRLQTVTWDAAYKEGDDSSYQTSLDGEAWSPWSDVTVWGRNGIGDGDHVLRIRARDGIGNVQPEPTEVAFTIDATPPLPALNDPTFNEVVAGEVAIRGSADDPRFVGYSLEVRGIGEEDWTLLSASASPVVEGVLGTWDTTIRPEGAHQIRLRVVDDVDLVGTVVIQVLVDNEAPFAAETSPVRMTPAGGEVYTTHGEGRAYVPPGAFAEETQVHLELAADDAVPGTLPDGAVRVWSGVDLSWGTAAPSKAAALDLRLPGDPAGTPAVYAGRGDGVWEFLGGTWDPEERTLSLSVQRPGLHAVFTGGSGISVVPRGLGPLTLTPRVLRPGGEPLTIGFSLEREGPVTVRVYNRAGRIVRTVARDAAHGAGLQAVRWDGRDEGGETAEDGLYLISVEALGSRQTKSVAVAR